MGFIVFKGETADKGRLFKVEDVTLALIPDDDTVFPMDSEVRVGVEVGQA